MLRPSIQKVIERIFKAAATASSGLAVGLGLLGGAEPATVHAADQNRPNILIIWGDDIGQFNISAYNMGMMGYKTPNIDRLAKEGVLFTDFYGQQSCTAGRAAFITGQSPIRTGLTKVGLPGAKEGITRSRSDSRQLAQAAGLHDGPVRQEPPWRPQRHAAHGPRVR